MRALCAPELKAPLRNLRTTVEDRINQISCKFSDLATALSVEMLIAPSQLCAAAFV